MTGASFSSAARTSRSKACMPFPAGSSMSARPSKRPAGARFSKKPGSRSACSSWSASIPIRGAIRAGTPWVSSSRPSCRERQTPGPDLTQARRCGSRIGAVSILLSIMRRSLPTPRRSSSAENAARVSRLVGSQAMFYLEAARPSNGASVMNERPRPGRYSARPASSEAAATGRGGVLLINLGTPDGTSYWPMRRYLKEFLSDRRVIETNRVLWWFIRNCIVLVKRPFTSGAKYRAIWNTTRDESPLRTITRSQAGQVARVLGPKGIAVDWAMRYGNPSIASRIEALIEEGCDRLLVFPLYPQYAAATTATANDKVFDVLKTLRAQPALRTAPPYPEDPVYIAALAHSIKTHLSALDFEPEAILASFHGMPRDYVDRGDPYQEQCDATVAALRPALGPLGAS